MAPLFYDSGRLSIYDGSISWTSNTIKVLLATSSYTPSAAHDFVNDVTNELSGGGYARQTLASKTASDNTGTSPKRKEYKCATSVFPSLGAAAGTPKWAVVYKDAGGADSANPLICAIDLGTAPAPVGQDYYVTWDASRGVFSVDFYADDFNRADSTTNPGSLWTATSGVAGISSNQLYASSGAPYVTTDISSTSYCMSWVLTATGSANVFSTLRFTDASNSLYLWWKNGASQYEIRKVVAGVDSTATFSAGAGTPAANDVFKVIAIYDGSTCIYRCYRNGTLGATLTTAQWATLTKVGTVLSNGTQRWDDVRIDGAFTAGTAVATAPQYVTPSLLTVSPTFFGAGVAVGPPLLVVPPTMFAATAYIGINLTPALLVESPVVFMPGIRTGPPLLVVPPTVFTPTVTLTNVATATASDQTPEPDTPRAELTDLVSAVWTALSPDNVLEEFETLVNGEVVDVDAIFLGGLAWRAETSFPFIQDVEYTVVSRARTHNGHWNSTTWSFTARPADPPIPVKTGLYVVKAFQLVERVVVPVTRGEPTRVRVSTVVAPGGWRTATPISASVLVTEGARAGDYVAVPVTLPVARLHEWAGVTIGGDAGVLHENPLQVGGAVRGVVEQEGVTIGGAVAGELQQQGLLVGSDVVTSVTRPGLSVGGDVVVPHDNPFMVGSEVRGAESKVDVRADLIPEELAEILS